MIFKMTLTNNNYLYEKKIMFQSLEGLIDAIFYGNNFLTEKKWIK